MAHFPGLCNSTHTMTETVIKRAPSMVVGELYTLRLKDDLPETKPFSVYVDIGCFMGNEKNYRSVTLPP